MQPAVLIRLRPAGPWRYGPGDGGQDRVDTQYRSDRLFSALTLSMKRLGWLDEWLEATAKATSSAVAFTSLFPYQGSTLFVTPPATLWPPPASLLTTPSPVFLSKIRWSVANFVPANLIETILLGQSILADQWLPDPESGCLLRRDRLSTTPFRTTVRSAAAVDRMTSSSASVHASAGVEFEPGAGLWTIVRYRDDAAHSDWGQRVSAAFRLLADGGFGGKRSSGWGQTEPPEFQEGSWPGLLFPKLVRALAKASPDADIDSAGPPHHWLLSLFSPAEGDRIDWSNGEYRVVVRGGYVEGASDSTKKQVRMIAEGSVLSSPEDLIGSAVDVAPEGFAHPVYRSGLALSLRLPTLNLVEPEAVPSELDEILSELEVAAAAEEPPVEPVEDESTAEAGPEQPGDSSQELIDETGSESSIEATATQPVNPPGSPEIQVDEQTAEVEPQNGSDALGSIEDPEPSGNGPDHGI
jgi:CRISPR type III-A-associated RAMP protein Csm4